VSDSTRQCPFSGPATAVGTSATARWWPDQLHLKISSPAPHQADPMGQEFDRAEEFKTLAATLADYLLTFTLYKADAATTYSWSTPCHWLGSPDCSPCSLAFS
jgi:catalase (peroxidase I)